MIERDVIIIGAGAAGLMCAIEAGKRGRSVLVLEHNQKIGEKIRISGGGKCNFTNINATPANYISQNPHFCKSALARYTPKDFLKLVEKHRIAYHEKKLGQIFCDGNAGNIIHLLLDECQKTNVEIKTGSNILSVNRKDNYSLVTYDSVLRTDSLVVATGGLSIPRLGATNFGYRIADQFGINIIPPKPGLVPLKINFKEFKSYRDLSGISLEAETTCNNVSFRENILFTHRGLSGPAILQISSYWYPGSVICINLLPNIDIFSILKKHRQSKKHIAKILEMFLPSRFVRCWLELYNCSKFMYQYSPSELRAISFALTNWQIKPLDTEGYMKAEITVGGIDTKELSSKTMESKKIPGLYFIGELADVTGWLGGYNFQWAWSSGWAAGQVV
jgi:predicted Rossmann fold flavoprotein